MDSICNARLQKADRLTNVMLLHKAWHAWACAVHKLSLKCKQTYTSLTQCFRDCVHFKELTAPTIFERRTLTGRETFSLLTFLNATKIVLLTVFTVIERICPQIWVNPLPKNAKCPLLVDKRLCLSCFLSSEPGRVRVK